MRYNLVYVIFSKVDVLVFQFIEESRNLSVQTNSMEQSR
jgi:hypothetical protein